MPSVIVLGAGPGGYAAAFYAADLGMQVTLVDEEKNPGGVCLYRGCIPSKALLHVAKLVDESKHASHWGVEFGTPKIDLDKLRAYKNSVVEKLTSGTGQIAKLRKVDYIQGRATLTGPTSMSVKTASGTQDVSADYIVLATGSYPTKIPGLNLDSPRLLDSTGALDLPAIPKTLLVVGGGYIGLELGSVYAALGTKVSVVEMTPTLLPGADRDLVKPLAQRIEKTFAKVMLATKVTGMVAAGCIFPVEVLMKSAPACMAISLALLTLSSVPSSPVSRITFNRAGPQASFIIAISSNTKLYSPAWNLPRLITISTSSAPLATAYFVSRIFTSRGACPLGKAVATDATLIPEPSRAFLATLTIVGYTQTAATVGRPGSASCGCMAL